MENTEKVLNKHIRFKENAINGIALYSSNSSLLKDNDSTMNSGITTCKGTKRKIGELWGKPLITGDKNLLTENEIWVDVNNKHISQLISKQTKNTEINLISNIKVYGTLDYTYSEDGSEVTNCVPLPTKIEDVWKNIDMSFNICYGGQRTVDASIYQGYTVFNDTSFDIKEQISLEEFFNKCQFYLIANLQKIPKIFNFVDFHLANPYFIITNAFEIKTSSVENYTECSLLPRADSTSVIVEYSDSTAIFIGLDIFRNENTAYSIVTMYNETKYYPVFYISPISNTVFMLVIAVSKDTKVCLLPFFNYNFYSLRKQLGLENLKVIEFPTTKMTGGFLQTFNYLIETNWSVNYMELG